jgi:hypothetical protein
MAESSERNVESRKDSSNHMGRLGLEDGPVFHPEPCGWKITGIEVLGWWVYGVPSANNRAKAH